MSEKKFLDLNGLNYLASKTAKNDLSNVTPSTGRTNLGITSGEAEPSGGSTGDIYIQTLTEWLDEPDLATTIVNIAYPVGSIYMSTAAVEPATLFGVGTWERITDTFLLASGNAHPAGTTGGEEEVVLSVEQLPAHTHTFETPAYKYVEDLTTNTLLGEESSATARYHRNTSSVGNNEAHNNMPPYLSVYVWKRTA